MEWLYSTSMKKISPVRHGFAHPGLDGGVHDNFSFKNGTAEAVVTARRNACAPLGVKPEHLTCLYQEHGVVIWDVKRSQRGAGALNGEKQLGAGDAMITADAGVPLAILVADCLPIFFSAPDGEAVGIAHAGWRGTVGNIAGKMVEKFKKDYSISPDCLTVWIAPGISPCCFQVKEDVWEPFMQNWGFVPTAFDPSRMTIDLKAVNRYQVLSAGIMEANLDISPDCTCCDLRYFSYRREGPGIGHNMAVIEKIQ